jgi:hypothetical protein
MWRFLILLLPFATCSFAYEPGSVSGEYLYYVEGKGKTSEQTTSDTGNKDKSVDKQNELYQKLVDQQLEMLKEISSLKKEQSRQLDNLLHMQQLDFIYRRALEEHKFKEQEESYHFLGFKKEEISDFYKKLGIDELLKSFDQSIIEASKNAQKQ